MKKQDAHELDTINFDEATGSNDAVFSAMVNGGDDAEDELYGDAKLAVLEAGKASTSYLQRKLRVGYSRAARLIDMLEEKGVVGPADGSRPREIMLHEESDSYEEDENEEVEETEDNNKEYGE